MDYINTENLFKCETCRRYRGGKCLAWCESYECYSPNMKKIPTADVVEVVRCKDCKHWGGTTFGFVCRKFSGIETKICMGADHFCSYGEKALKEREME